MALSNSEISKLLAKEDAELNKNRTSASTAKAFTSSLKKTNSSASKDYTAGNGLTYKVSSSTTSPYKYNITEKTNSPSYNSQYTDKLNDLLSRYEDAISSAGGISMPGLSLPDYVGAYDQQIDELLNKLLNREEFAYNSEEDPLYQQYKELYTKQGQLAMEDTMGVAAGLTGGYSSSYSEAVAQQQYNAYLQKLTELMPEFYDRAYGKYQDEGTNMKDLYGMYIDRDQVDFQRYQQEVANAQAEYQAAAAAASAAAAAEQNNISNLGNLYGLVLGADDTAYNRYMNEWSANYQAEQDKKNWNYQLSQDAYNKQQTAKSEARSEVDAILKAGGMPSSALISASGVSADYINALRNYYGGNTTTSSGGGGGSGQYTSDKDYKVNKDNSISVKGNRQLNYDPDEGTFKWNGKNYYNLNSLVNAWNNSSSLTDDDLSVLKRKLESQTNISLG